MTESPRRSAHAVVRPVELAGLASKFGPDDVVLYRERLLYIIHVIQQSIERRKRKLAQFLLQATKEIEKRAMNEIGDDLDLYMETLVMFRTWVQEHYKLPKAEFNFDAYDNERKKHFYAKDGGVKPLPSLPFFNELFSKVSGQLVMHVRRVDYGVVKPKPGYFIVRVFYGQTSYDVYFPPDKDRSDPMQIYRLEPFRLMKLEVWLNDTVQNILEVTVDPFNLLACSGKVWGETVGLYLDCRFWPTSKCEFLYSKLPAVRREFKLK